MFFLLLMYSTVEMGLQVRKISVFCLCVCFPVSVLYTCSAVPMFEVSPDRKSVV